jgi:uncharacterized OsmC-like protein
MTTEENVVINGLHPAKLEAVIEGLKEKDNLEAFSGPWRSRVVWQDGFKAKAHTRTHTVELDEPDALDTQDTGASAHEHLLSALGSCIMVGFVLNATRRGVQINNLEIAVEGHFQNILKWAGLDDDGNPGYGGIDVKIYAQGDADEATLQEIFDLAVAGSPVAQTVTRATPVHAELEIVL